MTQKKGAPEKKNDPRAAIRQAYAFCFSIFFCAALIYNSGSIEALCSVELSRAGALRLTTQPRINIVLERTAKTPAAKLPLKGSKDPLDKKVTRAQFQSFLP